MHRIARWLLKVGLAWLLLTGLPVLALRWQTPPTSAFMLRAQYDAWRQDRKDFILRHTWAPLAGTSPHAARAVLASEDQRFFRHAGFDFRAIEKVWRLNQKAHRPVHGASTISQQTAKNLFLYPERSFVRKGLEAWFTVLLEACLPKRRILEIYLNVAEFGDGIYGVEAASRAYFRKSSARLEPAEAALLAAVLPNPRRFRVDRLTGYVLKRRDWILIQMRRLGDAR